jgi:hypothetical protein
MSRGERGAWMTPCQAGIAEGPHGGTLIEPWRATDASIINLDSSFIVSP